MLHFGRATRDARIPLDNNRAENALRIVAPGRKNFMFVQSEAAGKERALLYSLVVSCKRIVDQLVGRRALPLQGPPTRTMCRWLNLLANNHHPERLERIIGGGVESIPFGNVQVRRVVFRRELVEVR